MPPRFTPSANVYKRPSTGPSDTLLHIVSKETLRNMHPIYVKAFEKARGITLGKRIDMRSFTNYADLERDIVAVNNKIQEYSNRPQVDGTMEVIVQAEILEAFMYDMIRNYEWFGANIGGILPSIFDDLFLGHDLILEQSHDGDGRSYTGVGIDFTLGEDSFAIKIRKIKERLSQGLLPHIKYFESPAGNFKGELRNVPSFVVGVSRETLFKLVSLWVNGDYEKLKKDNTRINLLQMMIMECDEFSKEANDHIKETYMREKAFLQKILKNI